MEPIVDALRESPREALIILAILAAIGALAGRLTHARYRHRRLHPRGLNSDPNGPVSILADGAADGGDGEGRA